MDTTHKCTNAQFYELKNTLDERDGKIPIKILGERLYLPPSSLIHSDDKDTHRLVLAGTWDLGE